MNKFLCSCFLLIAFPCCSFATNAPIVSWVELGPNNAVIARTITKQSTCPNITVDNKSAPMQLRASADKDYPVTVCETILPANAQTATIAKQALALPKVHPSRIVIIGDTGCRLKPISPIQDCNDPDKFPFAKIAAQAAKWKPDVVIHLGDYFYREMACPFNTPGCHGSPFGPNWATWQADFFTPAQSLLTAAPWVFVRGNHENCKRGSGGWLRYLDPFHYDENCSAMSPLYSVTIDEVALFVMDSSSAQDKRAPPELVNNFKAGFNVIKNSNAKHVWLATHKPLWTIVAPRARSTLQAAAQPAPLTSINLLLAGHVHDFEALNFNARPTQLIVGNSGTLLDLPRGRKDITGKIINEKPVTQGLVVHKFGFFTLEKINGMWHGQLHDVNGEVLANCDWQKAQLVCVKAINAGL